MAYSLDRRTFLRASGAAGSAAALGGLIPGIACAGDGDHFFHGVASGDPWPTSVLLWTRVTPDNNSTPGSGKGPNVKVKWELAADAKFTKVLQRGEEKTSAERDHTVKVVVEGLKPDTYYHYRFHFNGDYSMVGRTRTAPANNVLVDQLRFGVVSCANFEGGYFHAYRGLVGECSFNKDQDLNAVLHLGDYIYEYGNEEYGEPHQTKPSRLHIPSNQTYTLADYRQRHAQYKQDSDLQTLHSMVPFIVMWDDHEVADDMSAHASRNSDGMTFQNRLVASRRAYEEWMPIREVNPGYRSMRFGHLADLTTLDLRSYRSRQFNYDPSVALNSPDRTITGPQQMKWFLDTLKNGRNEAIWRVIGNPVMISPLKMPGQSLLTDTTAKVISKITNIPINKDALNADQWDGYSYDRDTVLAHIMENSIQNTAWLTGDIHTAWAGTVNADGYNAAVELICPSVTSESASDGIRKKLDKLNPDHDHRAKSIAMANEGGKAMQHANPHFDFVDVSSHGYSTLTITKDAMRFTWNNVGNVFNKNEDLSNTLIKALTVPVAQKNEIVGRMFDSTNSNIVSPVNPNANCAENNGDDEGYCTLY